MAEGVSQLLPMKVLEHILIGRKNKHIITKAFLGFISPGEAFVSLEVGIVRI